MDLCQHLMARYKLTPDMLSGRAHSPLQVRLRLRLHAALRHCCARASMPACRWWHAALHRCCARASVLHPPRRARRARRCWSWGAGTASRASSRSWRARRCTSRCAAARPARCPCHARRRRCPLPRGRRSRCGGARGGSRHPAPVPACERASTQHHHHARAPLLPNTTGLQRGGAGAADHAQCGGQPAAAALQRAPPPAPLLLGRLGHSGAAAHVAGARLCAQCRQCAAVHACCRAGTTGHALAPHAHTRPLRRALVRRGWVATTTSSSPQSPSTASSRSAGCWSASSRCGLWHVRSNVFLFFCGLCAGVHQAGAARW